MQMLIWLYDTFKFKYQCILTLTLEYAGSVCIKDGKFNLFKKKPMTIMLWMDSDDSKGNHQI